MSYKIFISHAWADRWVAAQIEQQIHDLGVATFIDVNDIERGDDIEDRIFAEMPACDELLVLFTPWAVDRNWVWVEIGAARGLRKRIVAVLYEVDLTTIEREKGGSTFLRSKNAVDINDLDTYFRELKNRIAKGKP
ncbi:MAG TPA: toll/interleukin-1 receptor domain-containing protein [Rhizobiaceae bacterium]